MSESKRFVVETVAVRDKVITDTEKGYSYEDLDEIVDKLNEQQDTITELKSIINFASNGEDLIVLLMKEIIRLRQEVEEGRAYETIEKGVSNYD